MWGMRILKVLLVGSSLTVPLFSLGCAADGVENAGDSVGSVSLALTGQSNTGVTYRLSTASFVITGPTSTVLSGNGDVPVVSTVLDVGSYGIQLASGWKLERSNGGAFTEVEATLTSPNPQTFVIGESDTTRVYFQFEAGDELVTIGEGNLEVLMNIVEADNSQPPTLARLIDNFADRNLASEIAGASWQAFSNGGAPTPLISFVPSPLDTALAVDFVGTDPFTSGVFLPISATGVDARAYAGLMITARLDNPSGPVMIHIVKAGEQSGYTAPVPFSPVFEPRPVPWGMFRNDQTGQLLVPDALSVIVLMPLQAPAHLEIEAVEFL